MDSLDCLNLEGKKQLDEVVSYNDKPTDNSIVLIMPLADHDQSYSISRNVVDADFIHPEYCTLQSERLDSVLSKEISIVDDDSSSKAFVDMSSALDHIQNYDLQHDVVNEATQTNDTHLVHLDKLQSEEDAKDCASHEQCHNIENIGVLSVITGQVTASNSPSVLNENHETITKIANHTGAVSTEVNDNNGSHHSDVVHSESSAVVTNLDKNKVKHRVFIEENNLHECSMLVDEVVNNTPNHDNNTSQKGRKKKKRTPSLVLHILKLLSRPAFMVTFFLINLLFCAMNPFCFASGQVEKCRINTVLNGSVELLSDDVSSDVREMPFLFLEYQDKDNPNENNLGYIPNCTPELSSKAQASIPGDN